MSKNISIILILITGLTLFASCSENFGSLLPSKIELSNNFRGDATHSIIQGTTTNLVFTYFGNKPISLTTNKSKIITKKGDCNIIGINEVIFGNIDSKTGVKNITFTNTPKTNFKNGEKGVVSFNCNQEIIKNTGKQLEGNAVIYYSLNNKEMNSSGPIRLNIK